MEIAEFFKEQKEIHKILLDFLEDETNLEESYQNYIFMMQKYQNLEDNLEYLKENLHLISNIVNNHSRPHFFIEKIERLLFSIKDKITKYFTNYEIFDIFKNSKLILLWLFENKILNADESIAHVMMNKKFSEAFYPYYFFNDIKNFIDEEKKEIIEKDILKITNNDPLLFEQKRKIGENDDFVCQMIRNDSIDEFIIFVTKSNMSLFATINTSIFESNSFLYDKNPTLIEYAAFFGSIQIFKYLFLNEVELNPSLWLYVIHSQKPDFIHLLEENNIIPEDKSFSECLIESIKCHHCDFTEYIENNLIQKENENENEKILFHLKYHNFDFNLRDDVNYEYLFYYLCRYDYISLVKNALNEKVICINELTISIN